MRLVPGYWFTPDMGPAVEVGDDPYAKGLDPRTIGERLALQRLEAATAAPLPGDAVALVAGADDLDLPVKGYAATSKGFKLGLDEVATQLGIDPTWLALVMSFETGETFSPSERNPVSGATGLIQFMPATARRLGTTTDKLAAMTAEEQLEYVRRYFEPHQGHLGTLLDVYMAVLWPEAIGRPEAVLWKEGAIEYTQNKGLDINGDGQVTAKEALARVESKRIRDTSPATLLVGDSLAVGLTPPLAGAARSRGRLFVSEAIGGTTITSWARGVRLQNALQASRPAVCVVCLGTNDGAIAFDKDAKLKDLRALTARVRDAGAALRWVLPPSLPYDLHGLRELLAEELHGVPQYDSTRLSFERSSDRIHATPAGYQTWANALAAWLWDAPPPAQQDTAPAALGGAGIAAAAAAAVLLVRRV